MADRMLSMQPGAIRVRNFRERKKQVLAPLPVTSSAPPATSSAPPAPSPASATPVTPSSSAWLRETQPVTGPGADAFAASVTLGEDGNGNEHAPPLVEPDPPPAPVTTSPEEAAMLGKIVGAYVGFGWGLMAQRHIEKLLPITDTLMKGHPELAQLPPEQKFQFGFAAMVGMVEQSATRLALKHNIRLPYQDEGIVGIAMATSTYGIVNEFKVAKNDNAPTAAAAEPRDVTPRRNAPAPAPSSAAAAAANANIIDLEDAPSARASQPVDAELVL